MKYLPRHLEPVLLSRLRQAPAVILTGARQSGKSTLVQHLPGAGQRRYRTLDALEDMELAEQEPGALLAGEQPVTLDEVQRVPSVLLAIKREIDRRRRNGRFLLTGSANLLLMRRVSETLAGRAQYLTLWPFTEAERRGRPAPGLWRELWQARGAVAALPAVEALASGAPEADLTEAIFRGGYPPVALQADGEAARSWFDGYVRTYLERDLQQLSQIDALIDFRRLMRISALRVGKLLNLADLARDAGLAPATAHRYLNLLEVSYQVVRLPAYAVNRTKRLIKAPKLFWTDTGLAAFLAGLDRGTLATMRGPLLENFVLCQLLAWRETETPGPEISYWRTAAGEEVDFVIEWRGKLLPIEVKASGRVSRADARSLESFAREYPEQCSLGILLYDGKEPRLLSDTVLALPLAVLW
jgi:predicted AAA+ superfamily ATPase